MSHVPGAFVSLKEDCAAAKPGGKNLRGHDISSALDPRKPRTLQSPLPGPPFPPPPPSPPSMRALDMANGVHIRLPVEPPTASLSNSRARVVYCREDTCNESIVSH